MIIKKSEEPPQRWFEYDENESYLLRYVDRANVIGKDDLEIAALMFVDWRGVNDAEGTPVPCNAGFVEEFMGVLEGRERFVWALSQAMNLNSFVDMEAIAKNLRRPSAGASTTRAPRPANATNAKPNGKPASGATPAP